MKAKEVRVLGYDPRLATTPQQQADIEMFVSRRFVWKDFRVTIKGGFFHGMIVEQGGQRKVVKGSTLEVIEPERVSE